MKDENRHAAADSPSSKFIGRKGQGTPPPEPAALESVQSAGSLVYAKPREGRRHVVHLQGVQAAFPGLLTRG